MFLPLSLVIIRFSAPPLVSSAPGAELISAGGAEKKTGGEKKNLPLWAQVCPPDFFLPPLQFFSAPAKINPAHATDSWPKVMKNVLFRKNNSMAFPLIVSKTNYFQKCLIYNFHFMVVSNLGHF